MKSKLEILNFIGSVCSIAALLIVVMSADMNLQKGFFIIISLIFAFCLVASITSFATHIFKRFHIFQDIFIKVCTIVLGSMLAVVISVIVFWVCYNLLETIFLLVSTLIDSVKNYN